MGGGFFFFWTVMYEKGRVVFVGMLKMLFEA